MYPQAGRCLDLGSFNTWQAAIPAAPQTPSCAWLVGAPVLASSVLIPVLLGTSLSAHQKLPFDFILPSIS